VTLNSIQGHLLSFEEIRKKEVRKGSAYICEVICNCLWLFMCNNISKQYEGSRGFSATADLFVCFMIRAGCRQFLTECYNSAVVFTTWCYACRGHADARFPSVCPSHVDVVSKRLNHLIYFIVG